MAQQFGEVRLAQLFSRCVALSMYSHPLSLFLTARARAWRHAHSAPRGRPASKVQEDAGAEQDAAHLVHGEHVLEAAVRRS